MPCDYVVDWKFSAPTTLEVASLSAEHGVYSLDPAMLEGAKVPSSFGEEGSLHDSEYVLHVAQQPYQALEDHVPRQHYAFDPHPSRPSTPPSSSSLSYSAHSSPRYFDTKSSLLPAAIIVNHEQSEPVADAAWFVEHQDPSLLSPGRYSPLYSPRNPLPPSPTTLYANSPNSTTSLAPPFDYSPNTSPDFTSPAFRTDAGGRRGSSLSISVPPLHLSSPYPLSPATMERVLSQEEIEEMDRMLVEIGAILGPEVMASLTPTREDAGSPSKRARGGAHQVEAAQQEQGYFLAPYGNEVEVVQPESYHSQRHYPASAPVSQANFDLSSRDAYLEQQLHAQPLYAFDPPYSLPHPSTHLLPSTPARPSPSHHPSHEAVRPHTSPERRTRPSVVNHRRSSSLDAREQSHLPYPSVLAGAHGPLPLPPPSLPPSPPHFPSTPPRTPSTPKTPKAPKSPKKASPKKTTPRGGKKPVGGSAFINYSACDAKKLLSGVAPSGSSKRKRDDDVPVAALE